MVMQDGDAEHALAQETTQSFPRQVDGYVELWRMERSGQSCSQRKETQDVKSLYWAAFDWLGVLGSEAGR